MIIIKARNEITKSILKILLDNKDPITVSRVASEVSMSERTIRSYLKEMSEQLVQNNVELVVKPSIGVYLSIDDEYRSILKQELEDKNSDAIDYSQEYRRYYILKTLLKNKYTYTIQLLADDLFCSKSTIVNDLLDIQRWLEKRDLHLKRRQNQGLWIEGSESNYRRALMDLFLETKEKECLDQDPAYEKLDYRIDFVNYKKIKSMFPRTDLLLIQELVQKAETMLGYYFTDQAFINLITHIAITIERVKSDKQIEMTRDFLNNLKGKYEYEVAGWLIKSLSEKLDVSFSDDEIGYISLHMLGAKIQEDVDSENCETLLTAQNEDYAYIAKEIIALAGEVLDIDLSGDKLLLTALTLHLRPTVVRLKYGLNLKNPMLQTIKNEYTSIFGAAWACSSVFERKLGVPINEDEVAYIAMHIAVAAGRLSKKVRAIVVCSSGIGTSQLVTSKLKKQFHELDVIATIPLSMMNEHLEQSADIIVSTIPGVLNSNKVVYVSTVLDATDIMRIKGAMGRLKITDQYSDKNSEEQLKDNVIESVIDENFIFTDSTSTNLEQIIKHYGKIMESKGYVKAGFCENVLEREGKASTYVGRGIAIPHSTDEYVLQSKICIIRLKSPIVWSDNKVRLVFILGLKFSDITITKTFFKRFYSILDDERLVNKIYEADSTKDIIKFFQNGGN